MESKRSSFVIPTSRAFSITKVREAGLLEVHLRYDRVEHPDELLVRFNWLSGVANASLNPFCSDEEPGCVELRNRERVNLGYNGLRAWRLVYKDVDCRTKLAIVDIRLSEKGTFDCEILRFRSVLGKVVQNTPKGETEIPLRERST